MIYVCKDVHKCVYIRDGPINCCFRGFGQRKKRATLELENAAGCRVGWLLPGQRVGRLRAWTVV